MKKVVFLLSAMILAGAVSTYAQEKQYKPEAMDFSLEVNYTPGLGLTGSGSDISYSSPVSLPEYGLKGRLFITDRFAVRMNLGFSTNSTRTKTVTDNGDNSTTTSTETDPISTRFSIMPGVEYHFGDFKRVSPYVGGAIGFSAGSTGNKYKSGNTSGKYTSPTFGFAINAVAGVDVYICQGLYAGLELGLGYGLEKAGKWKRVDIDNEGSQTEETGDTEVTNNSFGFFATPSIRIGWFF